MSNTPYPSTDLHRNGAQRTFTGASLSEVAFPIGGIGAGCISVGGRGELRDFEIFNQPNRDYSIPFTFFALWAKAEGNAPVARVLEGRIPPPYRRGGGEPQNMMSGLPRFSDAAFQGHYPRATVNLTDDAVPVTATLNAWNPFIPLNVVDSALPVAIFEWTLTNTADVPLEVSLAASMANPLVAVDAQGNRREPGSVNAGVSSDSLRGVTYTHPEADLASPWTGTLALATPYGDVDVVPQWYRGFWFDKSHIFWDQFAAEGGVDAYEYDTPAPHEGDVGSVILHATIPAGGSVTLPVYLGWHFPLMANPWREGWDDVPQTFDTYVSGRYPDAWGVIEYVHANVDRLRTATNQWIDTVFNSTLPDYVIEAVTSQASIMRSPTCLLLKDGSFFAWEGVWQNSGSCHGSCTHVWNYEQAVAFLFPELERSMRRTEFFHNTRESGNMGFRTLLPPGLHISEFKPAVDGQMGTIIQAYRDWQLSGDDEFLREIWPGMKRALEYAWTMSPEKMEEPSLISFGAPATAKRSIDSLWDTDKDGVIEGEQHNTYDIEFYGPNTLGTAMYLGALKACAEIAEHFGEPEKAEEYHSIYQRGRAKVDAELFNGEYYFQKVHIAPNVTITEALRSPETVDGNVVPKYQYGEGCLSDQILGQWASHVAGLGYILDPEHVRSAVHAIFLHNFRSCIGDVHSVQRIYALNDEAGLLLCSWPNGNRPKLPFVYCDEVWTGIEFQVASHLIYEGYVDEGLTIVNAVAGRYAGHNRNPWNQIEWGYHYARAMASWSVKLALDGFRFSAVESMLGFAPRLNAQDYRTFWSTGTGWGEYRQNLTARTASVTVLCGPQTLSRLELASFGDGTVQAQVDGASVSVERADSGAIVFAPALTFHAGQTLVIAF